MIFRLLSPLVTPGVGFVTHGVMGRLVKSSNAAAGDFDLNELALFHNPQENIDNSSRKRLHELKNKIKIFT